jgi:hypothetical protein
MARGWESKAVETQQEEATRGKARRGRMPTAEERAAATARRTLELSRAKVEGDLRRATTEAHREMLRRALADLDRRLEHLGSD